ncbi:MAG: hypothetical protein LBR33_10745, partial [Propionibacteriaceae bacterium]|nr:hypothetical protein [Propionibacteriaceae bacterium]
MAQGAVIPAKAPVCDGAADGDYLLSATASARPRGLAPWLRSEARATATGPDPVAPAEDTAAHT